MAVNNGGMTMTEAYFDTSSCDIDAFAALTGQSTDPASVPHALEIVQNIPIYDGAAMPDDAAGRQLLMAEWAAVFLRGPGVLAIKGACADLAALDRATAIFEQIIAGEKASGASNADHFAAGTNDRIWNSLQKLCLADPAVFAACFANPAVDAACEAWLGPNYQMTTQVNLVHPGGEAQKAHRDYHLGFQTAQTASLYPAHVHDLSPVLTLQGAIAHCDMPVSSGPTKLLPFSQAYRPGYLAWRLPAFRDYFEDTCVQLPLAKGDALFFNPALFHAAGANTTTDIHRMANLMQIGSAMGRTLENPDRLAMCRALYPHLVGHPPSAARSAVIAACAEGYPFPTNLDSDPPIGGLAPESQAALFHRGLDEGMSPAAFNAALEAQARRKRP